MADNTTTLIGNCTRDPELKFTQSGQAVTTFGLAVNRRWQNKQTQEWDEQTSFFDVVCWARLAENVSESVQKGDRIIVEGRLDQRSWETDQGDKRSKVEIVANDVGPSLKWATAEVMKNERSDGYDDDRQSSSRSSQRSSGNRSSGNRSSGGGRQSAPASGYAQDEEPF